MNLSKKLALAGSLSVVLAVPNIVWADDHDDASSARSGQERGERMEEFRDNLTPEQQRRLEQMNPEERREFLREHRERRQERVDRRREDDRRPDNRAERHERRMNYSSDGGGRAMRASRPEGQPERDRRDRRAHGQRAGEARR